MVWEWLQSVVGDPRLEAVDWIRVLAVGIEVALLGLVFAWLGRSTAGDAETGDHPDVLVLRYAPVWRRLFVVLGFGMLGVLGAIYAIDPPSQWDPPGSDGVPVTIFGGFALLCALGYLETARTRVEVSSAGIAVDSVWRGERRLGWHLVDRITYSPSMMWFVLHGTDGTRLRVSHTLRGVPAFGARVREHLGGSVYRDVERLFDVSPFADL